MNPITPFRRTQFPLVRAASIQHVQPVVKSTGIRHTAEKVHILLEHEIVVVLKSHHLVSARAQSQGLNFDVSVK